MSITSELIVWDRRLVRHQPEEKRFVYETSNAERSDRHYCMHFAFYLFIASLLWTSLKEGVVLHQLLFNWNVRQGLPEILELSL